MRERFHVSKKSITAQVRVPTKSQAKSYVKGPTVLIAEHKTQETGGVTLVLIEEEMLRNSSNIFVRI